MTRRNEGPRASPTRKTLDRALSRSGAMSRGQAQEAIRAGRVRVEGLRVLDPGMWVDTERDRIELDNAPLRPKARLYLALHKPVGYVTTRDDERGRATVYELLKEHDDWIAPVGRLDRDTSGLLLFTNDSDWAELVTNPSSKLYKRYECLARGELSDEQLEQLRKGVALEDGTTAPAQVRRIETVGADTRLEIAIREGRNRQVRRMVEALGSRVLTLHRTAIGELELGALAPGAQRKLRPFEVRGLAGQP